MKYSINDRVFVSDDSGKYSATITDIMEGDTPLYKCSYDMGGYDYLLAEEIEPLQYHIGDKVRSALGKGIVVEVGKHTITVSYGNVQSAHFERELAPDKPKKKRWFS